MAIVSPRRETGLSGPKLAGGCFWGLQAYLRRIPGVAETTVGYANGHTENPTYHQVCTGQTGRNGAGLL